MKSPHELDSRKETGFHEKMKHSGPIKTISPKASLPNHIALLDRRTQMLLFGNDDISLSMEELCRAPRYRKRSFVRRNALNLSSRSLHFSPCSSYDDIEKLDDQATSSTKSQDLLDRRSSIQDCSTVAHDDYWENMTATQDFVDESKISSLKETQSVVPRKVSMLGASSEYSYNFEAKCCDLDVGFPRSNSFSSYSSDGEKHPSISNNFDTNSIEQQCMRDNRRRSLFNGAFNGFISQKDDKEDDSVLPTSDTDGCYNPDETQLKRRGSSLSIQQISQRLRRKSINCWTVDDTRSSSKDPRVSTSDSYNTDQNHRENNPSMVGEITKCFRRASLSLLGKHQVSLRRISVDNTPLEKEETKNDNILLSNMKRVDTLNLLNVLNSQSDDET